MNRPTLTGRLPIVIAHRGASGTLPDHTLESYRLAIRQGADFIEPDLVPTRDGVLIARHEPNITETTDVGARPQFADRRTTKTIDGQAETGWFAEDFTLAEIKTLRAAQPLAFRDQSHNGLYAIASLQEVIDLARNESVRTGRPVGIYPEIKHPSYFRGIGLPLEEPLLAALAANGLDRSDAPVFIQSFEVANLKRLASATAVPLVQLIGGYRTAAGGTPLYGRPYDFTLAGDMRTYADLISPTGLAEIARYAAAIGPWKHSIVPVHLAAGAWRLTRPSGLVADAHAAGLLVHPYTFRNEARYLAADYADDPAAEYRQFYTLGVDGVFSDFPGTAVEARMA
jgi:glycerophosphoryl diester phosphodiesterase